MRFFLLVATIFLSLNVFAKSEYNLNKSGVILDGYDAVSYFLPSGPQKGLATFQVKLEGVTYWFANESNKMAFLKDPKKFEPQFGGWCAYAVADSKSKVEVDPKSFVIQDNRLLVFYDGVWADTRKKWLNTKNKNSKVYLQQADLNWPETKTKEP